MIHLSDQQHDQRYWCIRGFLGACARSAPRRGRLLFSRLLYSSISLLCFRFFRLRCRLILVGTIWIIWSSSIIPWSLWLLLFQLLFHCTFLPISSLFYPTLNLALHLLFSLFYSALSWVDTVYRKPALFHSLRHEQHFSTSQTL